MEELKKVEKGLLKRLVALVYEVNEQDLHTVDFEIIGSLSRVELRVYINGHRYNVNADVYNVIMLDTGGSLDSLLKAIENLERLLL